MQVLLDKNINIKTVVNKTAAIDTTFRFFKMEVSTCRACGGSNQRQVIAGEHNFITEARENGCRFQMDYSQVRMHAFLFFASLTGPGVLELAPALRARPHRRHAHQGMFLDFPPSAHVHS